MSRLDTMARFAEPDEKEPLAYCYWCECDLSQGSEAILVNGNVYCDRDCYLNSSDIENIIIGE